MTLVPAVHTSSVLEHDTSVYLGEPTGFIVRMEDGDVFYFAGDTAVFGDMRLIAEMYAPRIAFLPIGGHFTLGPEGAARAAGEAGAGQAWAPCHVVSKAGVEGRAGSCVLRWCYGRFCQRRSTPGT